MPDLSPADARILHALITDANAPNFPRIKKIVEKVAKEGEITKRLMNVTRYETKPYLNQQIFDIEKASRGE